MFRNVKNRQADDRASRGNRPRRARDSAGITFIETLIVLLLIGLLLIPTTKFMTGIFKGLLNMENRYRNQNFTLKSVVDIERDFKDMNEVSYCDAARISFYMDSHRLPGYNPNGDSDGDRIPNRTDTDDDGDGFDHIRTALQFAALRADVAGSGWRQGLDLQDDDDDNDGHRDVLCTYFFDPGDSTLKRQFTYNGGSPTTPQIVLENVIAFAFTPTGSFASHDPITGDPPNFVDSNLDGVLSVDEVGGFPLDTFPKTRSITTVAYAMTIKPIPHRPETFNVSSSVKPLLMSVKEKYR